MRQRPGPARGTAAIAALALALAACAPFPEVASQQPDSGPYPALLPMDDLLAQADAP